MKASELRIGNKLLVGGGLKENCVVLSISDKLISYETKTRKGECNIEWLNAIPLTEEWLLKFGFEKIRYEKYAHIKLNKLRAYPHVIKNGFGIYLMGSYTLPHIKYIHQLQNLYFALTGEELIIK